MAYKNGLFMIAFVVFLGAFVPLAGIAQSPLPLSGPVRSP